MRFTTYGYVGSFFRVITPVSSFFGIPTPALESITMTIADVQAHLRMPITLSTILPGHSLESDLRALQLSRGASTLGIPSPTRAPGIAWLTRKWLDRTMQARRLGGHDSEEDAGGCVDLLKSKWCAPLLQSKRTGMIGARVR